MRLRLPGSQALNGSSELELMYGRGERWKGRNRAPEDHGNTGRLQGS